MLKRTFCLLSLAAAGLIAAVTQAAAGCGCAPVVYSSCGCGYVPPPVYYGSGCGCGSSYHGSYYRGSSYYVVNQGPAYYGPRVVAPPPTIEVPRPRTYPYYRSYRWRTHYAPRPYFRPSVHHRYAPRRYMMPPARPRYWGPAMHPRRLGPPLPPPPPPLRSRAQAPK
jgi:hypothetical protein